MSSSVRRVTRGWCSGFLCASALAQSSVTSVGGHPVPATPTPATLELVDVSSGFGQVLPHRIRERDAAGNPTPVVLDIRTLDVLYDNVTPNNPVLPTATLPAVAVLPNGAPGNHFLVARFSDALALDVILSSDPAAQIDSGLTGAIRVFAVDPVSGVTSPIRGRVLVGGRTYAGVPSGSPPALSLQTWVQLSGGALVANPAIDNDGNGIPDGLGVPGTAPGSSFALAASIADPRTFTFVVDSDGDLSTYETFPAGEQLSILITNQVRSEQGARLLRQARGALHVSSDNSPPEIFFPSPGVMAVTPTPGATNVDPLTSVRLEFREPIQPLSLGPMPGTPHPGLSNSVSLRFGPPGLTTIVPFTARPLSALNFFTWVLEPAFAFPGQAPADACGDFDRVTVTLNAGAVTDLVNNGNLIGASSFFDTGAGPALVNAPVTPDAIYAMTKGATSALRVLDLNGFGASTGNPQHDPSGSTFVDGWTNHPFDPNVRIQGAALRPPLTPGTCTINGGSAGVFHFTLDSSLSPDLVRAPIVLDASDAMLGHALDTSFNESPAPFGCQAGGGNLCAFDGVKILNPVVNGNIVQPSTPGVVNPLIGIGAENLSSWAPHPNPPPLVFPSLCAAPNIAGQEPTGVDTSVPNLLGPGDPFGVPGSGIAPSGLLTPEQNTFFQGPSLPAPNPSSCGPYMIRQQIGQFLYVVDRVRREVVVLNSNRMTVVDRIATPDPVTLAMSPNLDLLAVVNQLAGSVSFIDIDPFSASFHEVVHVTPVGPLPRGAAWEPGNEDILVCNEGDDTLSILSANSLQVRKVVASLVRGPFDVAITPRQVCFGFQRNVYFGYVIGRSGTLSVFESGPSGVNGWGYDDVLGLARFGNGNTMLFRAPKAIQPDPIDLRSGVWIAHQGPIDVATGTAGSPALGALSKLVIGSASVGQLALVPGSPPQFRSMFLDVPVALGEPQLSGKPVDLAFDDQRHLAGLPNFATVFSAGTPAPINGKQLVRGPCGSVVNTNEPRYLMLAVPGAAGGGEIDVLRLNVIPAARLDTNAFLPGVQSVPCADVSVLASYFRQ